MPSDSQTASVPDPDPKGPAVRDEVNAEAAAGLAVHRVTSLDPQLLARLTDYGRSALGASALDEWMLPVIAAHGFLFVAVAGAEIVGAAEVIVSARGGDLYLEGFYIRPGFQGRGHGTVLLARVCDTLTGSGHARLLATVAPGNGAARHLYEKTGFVRIDYLSDLYGPGRDRLLMALPLKEEAQ